MISVIIPTFNEAENLPSLLVSVVSQSTAHQIIVVDGGSSDATLQIAADFKTQIVQSEKGRGQQLKVGAELAQGEILFFLHADCQFPAGGLAAIQNYLQKHPKCPGGNFSLQFDGETDFATWLTRFYGWIRRHGLYYGDSGIFVRREVYAALGGIRPLALMEDYNFTRRLEKVGKTCCIADPSLITSSRKFEGRRSVAIVSGWLRIHALYYLGVAPEKLAKVYYKKG
jgi:rSAM/selenodomain-associated transferase 2